jgi:hypothetical protein
MRIRALDDVDLDALQPPVPLALSLLATAPADLNVWVTSVSGKEHSEGSLHPHGAAIDLDCERSTANHLLRTLCEQHLPDAFDVVREDAGEANDHVHIEYDPA